MTQTDTHPHRSDLRRRADRLLTALDAAPTPQTLPDIMRTARALMIIDRLLTQLWKTAPAKSGRQPVSTADAADTAPLPDETPGTAPSAMAAAPPLNRHQRRQQAARDRGAHPDGDTRLHRETG